MIGQQIGSYRIVGQLGEGGMGAVFAAVHQQISRQVAIKVLHADLSRRPEILARFFNEARAVNIVRHPGLVSVYELGQLDDGRAYIVMEHLEGETLRGRLHRRVLPLLDALSLSRQVASALAATHASGIVHRDLKPDNVMIVPDAETPLGERVKLLDFGIAKLATGQAGEVRTSTGMVLGTPCYMAPEQCRDSGQVDGRADVYALGVMLYEMLAGRPPFQAAGMGDLMMMHINEPPCPLHQIDGRVPMEVSALVDAMLAKAPAARPAMDQVAAALSQLGASPAATPHPSIPGHLAGECPPAPSRPLARGALAALVAGATLLGVGVAGRLQPERQRQVPVSATAERSAPPPTVRWVVHSQPPGAEVVRKETGEVLGRTPWSERRAALLGARVLVLRLPGYHPQEIALDGATATEREVLLHPVPAAPRPVRSQQDEKRSNGGKEERDDPTVH